MVVNGIDIESVMSEACSEENVQERVMDVFCEKLDEDNDYLAKTIAAYVRMNIEDFHHKYLSDEQMKELNPLIRNAIYTFLEDWTNGHFSKIWGTRMLNCPEYWEDCEYIEN